MKNTLEKARLYCEANNVRLTDPRRRILEILLKQQKPMGAYEILNVLEQYIEKPKPPTVYRAIDFWREHGFVHKIESLNAFMVCCEGRLRHDPHFLICDSCSSVQEIHSHAKSMDQLPNGFVAKRKFTETHGTCETCSQ